jgi:ATP-dependent Clp protease adaptor protein ClpS
MATLLEIEERQAGQDDSGHAPLYNVVLLDDDYHTYDYIIEMLGKLFLHSPAQAFRHAVEVDTEGRSIIMTCELTHAEYARDQIHGYGRDFRVESCQGSNDRYR